MTARHDRRPVLVIGATGTVGHEVVGALISRDVPVRVLVRDAARAKRLLPPVEQVVGDLRVPTEIAKALHGVRSAFYVSPHDPNEVDLARTFLRECEAAGVRLVFAGVHIPDNRRLSRTAKRLLFSAMLPAYRGKLRVGEMVVRSATRPVVLTGTHFMQNDELFAEDIRNGEYPIPLAPGGVNRVDVRDIADRRPSVDGAHVSRAGRVSRRRCQIDQRGGMRASVGAGSGPAGPLRRGRRTHLDRDLPPPGERPEAGGFPGHRPTPAEPRFPYGSEAARGDVSDPQKDAGRLLVIRT